MNKDEVIRLIAKETNFTIKDVRIIINAFVQIFEEAVLNRVEIKISGFGKLTFTTIPPRQVPPNTVFPKGAKLSEAIRLNFKLSPRLTELVKKRKKK